MYIYENNEVKVYKAWKKVYINICPYIHLALAAETRIHIYISRHEGMQYIEVAQLLPWFCFQIL